ncbi:PREDICTED: uncharacterized protein LOC102250059 [Myotis brandtii]|uniref:uncharacterized protein LOC102250059 n=1 Tax=Myotis brandtii TaxID=109478 RepID=UPI0003BB6DB4|nr:PREDICTED: uncharacterized protein LOC102250059 [Myotis brandtii]
MPQPRGQRATPQLRWGLDWSCRRVLPIARARDWRLGLRGGGAGKCPDPWSLKLGTSPPPTRPCLRPVPSDLHPVCGVELSGTPSQSWGLVWAAVAEPESAGHCRRRPVRRPTRDWPPNFFPGRRPRSRPGRGGGSPGAERARVNRSRRRRGNKSGDVSLRAWSLQSGPSGTSARGIDDEDSGAEVPPPVFQALEGLCPVSFPLAPWLWQDKTARGRRWAWECSPSPLPPSQAISLPPGARAVGAAQPRNLSPLKGSQPLPLLLRACPGPNHPGRGLSEHWTRRSVPPGSPPLAQSNSQCPERLMLRLPWGRRAS